MSNLVPTVNAWFTYKTAGEVQDLAKTNRVLAKDMGEMRDLMKINVHIAMQTNQQLSVINETLCGIGFVLQDVNETMKEVLGSLNRQENMHRKYYDEINKEKYLKEILYKMKKFQESNDAINDNVVGAYAGKILVNILEEYKFSTSDLSDLKDKEYFDERLNEAKIKFNGLSQQDKAELEAFESVYSRYQYLNSKNMEDLRKEFPEQKQLKQFSNEIVREQLPKDMQGLYIKDIKNTIDKLNKIKKKSKIFTYILLVDILLFPISVFLYGKKYLDDETWTIISLIIAFSFVYSLVKRIGIMFSKESLLYDFNKKSNTKINAKELLNLFDTYKSLFYETKSKIQIEVDEYNKKVDEENKSIKQKISEAQKKFNDMKADMQKMINNYLDKHQLLQGFLPKV